MGCGCKKVKARVMPPSYAKKPTPSIPQKGRPSVNVKH